MRTPKNGHSLGLYNIFGWEFLWGFLQYCVKMWSIQSTHVLVMIPFDKGLLPQTMQTEPGTISKTIKVEKTLFFYFDTWRELRGLPKHAEV